MNYLPEGFIPEEVGEKSDRIMEEMYKYEPLRQSREQLESTMLNEKYRYYKQMGIVKECLKEAYGEHCDLIIITNRFLSVLEDFMDAYNALQIGKNDTKKFQELKDKYDYERSCLSSYLSTYGSNIFNKIEEENPNIGIVELSKISNNYDDRFIQSLQERLTYVPKIEK